MKKIQIITVVLDDWSGLIRTAESIKNSLEPRINWLIKFGTSNSNHVPKTIKKKILNNDYVESHFLSDRGIYHAMNQAVRASRGDYLLFLNSGDKIYSDHTLSFVLSQIDIHESELDLLYGDCIDVKTDGDLIYKRSRELNYMRYSLPTSHQAIFYHKDLFNISKYLEDYALASDYATTATFWTSKPLNYLRLEKPIAYFELGGFSTKRRDILLKEGWRISREIFKENKVFSSFLFIKRLLTFILLDYFPKTYKFVRKLLSSK